MSSRHAPPAPLTPLIGRGPELSELVDLVAVERVLTLTGAGGCGKTRLAYELAARSIDAFAGGVAWVELAACSDRDDVVAALVDALEMMEAAGEAGLEGALRTLASRPACIVVLDNAEHVVTATAEVASAIAQRAPHARVVTTSREPIGVAGEIVWRVPSLSTPLVDHARDLAAIDIAAFDAVQLFLDRARRVRRGFRLTDANAADIAQICVRLDGLPLAIELAAARVRTMPPERIAAQLDDRFRLLAGGPRTLMARQQTLQASVAWSEELLDDTERVVFRRLGVFAAGFTADAAEEVVGAFGDIDPYDVAEAVRALVDKSLVQFDDERDRYSLLDTIRSYALQRLQETGETARARDAHAEWCARWLDRAAGDDHVDDVNSWWESRLEVIGRVDPEWPNCAAALDWARVGSALSLRLVAGLGDYWALRQRATDSGRYGMPPLVAGDRATPEWMHAVLRMQSVRTNAGDPVFAGLRGEASALAVERNDRRSFVRLEVARHIAMIMLLGPRRELVDALVEVRAEAVALHEWYTVWNATQSTGLMLVAAGRVDEGEALVAELTSARAQLIRSVATQLRGRLEPSLAMASDAHGMADARLGAALDRVIYTFAAAGGALALADPAVLHALQLAEVNLESLPPAFGSAYALANGVALLLDGQIAAARDVFAERPPDIFTSWRLVCLLAETEIALGDPEAAREVATRLVEMAADVPAPLYEAIGSVVLAECDRSTDVSAALDHAHRALSVAAEAGLWPVVVDALEALGALLADVGRTRDSARVLAACEAARTAMSYRFLFPHRAATVAAARSLVRADDGWDDGAAMSLPEAVEVVQRMRGERLRPTVGWDSLTPTELLVVEQVAAGLTNPQIAERLFMSRATVKTHLVHVYSKLSISNRAELAAHAIRRTSLSGPNDTNGTA